MGSDSSLIPILIIIAVHLLMHRRHALSPRLIRLRRRAILVSVCSFAVVSLLYAAGVLLGGSTLIGVALIVVGVWLFVLVLISWLMYGAEKFVHQTQDGGPGESLQSPDR